MKQIISWDILMIYKLFAHTNLYVFNDVVQVFELPAEKLLPNQSKRMFPSGNPKPAFRMKKSKYQIDKNVENQEFKNFSFNFIYFLFSFCPVAYSCSVCSVVELLA